MKFGSVDRLEDGEKLVIICDDGETLILDSKDHPELREGMVVAIDEENKITFDGEETERRRRENDIRRKKLFRRKGNEGTK